MLTLTFTPSGRYACPGLGSTRDLAVFNELGLDPRLEQRDCGDCPVFTSCKMSHWTQMAVEISDIPALRTATEQLGMTWQVGGVGRGYRSQTRGGDFVLRTDRLKSPYDIVATKDALTGKLNLNTDWYMGHIERIVGKDYGRLLQHYGIAKAHAAAKAKGYTTSRATMPNGDIKLEIFLPA